MTQPGAEPAQMQPQAEELGFFERNKRRIAGAAIAVIAVVGAGVAITKCGGESESNSAIDRDGISQECETAVFGNESANPNKYESTAFLPKTDKIEDGDDVTDYLNKLFNNGPLGNSISPASLAAFEAAVTVPATDGAVINPRYDYVSTFRQKAAAYGTKDTGLEAARNDCLSSFNVAVQTAEYSDDFAQKGETLIRLTAVRYDKLSAPEKKMINSIYDMKLEQVVTTEGLKGVAFKLRTTNKGVDGFIEVLVDKDGNMYVKGLEQPQAADSDTGGGTFGTSNGNGESNQPGNVPESGGNGGFTPGTAPSFGPGGGTGGPTPTQPTTPPHTNPPVTNPPVTTPPTTQPKGSAPTLPTNPSGY